MLKWPPKPNPVEKTSQISVTGAPHPRVPTVCLHQPPRPLRIHSNSYRLTCKLIRNSTGLDVFVLLPMYPQYQVGPHFSILGPRGSMTPAQTT